MRSLIGCTYKCADAGRGQEMYGRFLHGVSGGSLRSSVAKRERERTVGHDEAAFDVMNGAHRRHFQGTRLPARPVRLKATSWQDAIRAQGRQEWCEKDEGMA